MGYSNVLEALQIDRVLLVPRSLFIDGDGYGRVKCNIAPLAIYPPLQFTSGVHLICLCPITDSCLAFVSLAWVNIRNQSRIESIQDIFAMSSTEKSVNENAFEQFTYCRRCHSAAKLHVLKLVRLIDVYTSNSRVHSNKYTHNCPV